MSHNTLTGGVVAPWDPRYNTARLDYNARFNDIHPAYVVYCHVPEDVSQAIRWARRHHMPFRLRSGGHSYEAYSLVECGLVIDVSRMRHIHWDAATGLARIGAGAALIDVYQTLWDLGRVTIPGGSCAGVGIAGLTLGGGFGLVSRQFGLTIDALEEVLMLDAEGCPVRASADQHPDLFWGLRGAGANNFGAVAELTFRTHPVDNVAIFHLQWAWDRLPEVVPVYQVWSDPVTSDARLTSVLTLNSRQQGFVSIIGEFLGPQDALESQLAPLLAIPGRTAYTIQTETYIEAVRHFAGLGDAPEQWLAHGLPEQDIFKNTSAYAYDIFSEAALSVIQDALAHTPGPSCLVQLGSFGGAIRQVPPRETAFFHRYARSEMQYQAYWTSPAVADAHIRWVEDFRRAMLPFTVGAYVNYCDGAIKDWPQAYWGPNLDRLIRIKRHWDPDKVFRYPQGLSQLI